MDNYLDIKFNQLLKYKFNTILIYSLKKNNWSKKLKYKNIYTIQSKFVLDLFYNIYWMLINCF